MLRNANLLDVSVRYDLVYVMGLYLKPSTFSSEESGIFSSEEPVVKKLSQSQNDEVKKFMAELAAKARSRKTDNSEIIKLYQKMREKLLGEGWTKTEREIGLNYSSVAGLSALIDIFKLKYNSNHTTGSSFYRSVYNSDIRYVGDIFNTDRYKAWKAYFDFEKTYSVSQTKFDEICSNYPTLGLPKLIFRMFKNLTQEQQQGLIRLNLIEQKPGSQPLDKAHFSNETKEDNEHGEGNDSDEVCEGPEKDDSSDDDKDYEENESLKNKNKKNKNIKNDHEFSYSKKAKIKPTLPEYCSEDEEEHQQDSGQPPLEGPHLYEGLNYQADGLPGQALGNGFAGMLERQLSNDDFHLAALDDVEQKEIIEATQRKQQLELDPDNLRLLDAHVENNTLLQENDKVNAVNSTLMQEMATLREKFLLEEEKNRNNTNEIIRLKEEVSAEQKKRDESERGSHSYQIQVAVLEQKIINLNDLLMEKKQEITQLQGKLTEEQTTNHQRTVAMAQLETQKETIVENLRQTRAEIEKIRQESTAEIERLRAQQNIVPFNLNSFGSNTQQVYFTNQNHQPVPQGPFTASMPSFASSVSSGVPYYTWPVAQSQLPQDAWQQLPQGLNNNVSQSSSSLRQPAVLPALVSNRAVLFHANNAQQPQYFNNSVFTVNASPVYGQPVISQPVISQPQTQLQQNQKNNNV